MQRVLVLGRGGAGKTTFAGRLSSLTGLPLTELDQVVWQDGLRPLSRERWVEVQQRLSAGDRWILDGDLGPYDVLLPRLRRADTIVVLDFSLARCVWRAARRGRENADFWRWVWSYRRRSLPSVLAAIGSENPTAQVHVLRSPRAADRLLGALDTTA
jgi:adenylate kinase family enzyme